MKALFRVVTATAVAAIGCALIAGPAQADNSDRAPYFCGHNDFQYGSTVQIDGDTWTVTGTSVAPDGTITEFGISDSAGTELQVTC